MKTHEKRALFSKALLKAATCLFLTNGLGISIAFALPQSNELITEKVQHSSTINGKGTDANGEAISGTSVTVKGAVGTITNLDGKYRYPCKSHIGCILYNQDLSSRYIKILPN